MTTNSVAPEFHSIWHLIDNNYTQRLLQRGDLGHIINAKQRGYTPLHLAIVRHHHEIIRALLAQGADPNGLSRQRTPLYMATLFAETELMYDIFPKMWLTSRVLLIEYGANLNTMCSEAGPIHLAAARGIAESCQTLIDAGANLDLMSNAHGTALHICIKKDHKFIAKLLLANGANPHAVNSEGESCIYKACQDGNIPILKLLLEKATASGCATPDSEGNTPLHISAQSGHLEATTLLIEKFPSLVPIQNNANKSVLFYLPRKMRGTVESMSYLNSGRPNTQQNLPSTVEIQFATTELGQKKSCVETFCVEKSRLFADGPYPTQLNTYLPTDSLLHTISPAISFKNLVNNPTNSDVTITTKDTTIVAHSCILWARWPMKRPFLEKGEKPLVLELHTEPHATVISLLYYLYSDSLRFPKPETPIPPEERAQEKIKATDALRALAKREQLHRLERNDIGSNTLAFLCDASLGNVCEIHQSTISSDIENLLSSRFASDVTIISENQKTPFPVHQTILSAHSQYFKAMMDPTRSLRESSSKTIKMGFDANVTMAIITHLYTNKAPKKMDDTQLLEFMLHELSIHCQIYLGRTYTEENVYDLFELADHLNAFYLRENCLDYLIRCFPAIRNTEAFKNMPAHLKEEIASNFSFASNK